jgi:hypothetical protein
VAEAGGGFGLGFVSEKSAGRSFSGGRGSSVTAGVGVEILQRTHLALGLDLHGSYTGYASESWQTAGLDLSLSFF